MNVHDSGAKGDGTADDTPAIQAVFDRTPETNENYAESLRHRVIYFPAGRYRLTKTLVLAKSHGAWLVGHGRDTVLIWDGVPQGSMLWNNGATYARYEKKHVLLFANPHSRKARTHHTIQVSFDDGRTWPKEHHLLLDEGRGAMWPHWQPATGDQP